MSCPADRPWLDRRPTWWWPSTLWRPRDQGWVTSYSSSLCSQHLAWSVVGLHYLLYAWCFYNFFNSKVPSTIRNCQFIYNSSGKTKGRHDVKHAHINYKTHPDNRIAKMGTNKTCIWESRTCVTIIILPWTTQFANRLMWPIQLWRAPCFLFSCRCCFYVDIPRPMDLSSPVFFPSRK